LRSYAEIRRKGFGIAVDEPQVAFDLDYVATIKNERSKIEGSLEL
jgi:hypothetical protein